MPPTLKLISIVDRKSEKNTRILSLTDMNVLAEEFFLPVPRHATL
jgi:hypothetical protein